MLAQAERTLLDPWFLALVPLAVFFFVWRMRRRRAALPAGDVTLLHSLPKTLRSRLVHLPTVLKLLAVASLALAMARPVSRDRLPLRELGVDIMIVLDTSTSMEIADMVADRRRRRMDVARGQALAFVAARTNDRVGLMTYAQYPELRCPLTLDQNALEEFLLDVDIVTDRREDGTAIGVALAKAVAVLEGSDAASKVVVLLTDGQNNRDTIMPLDAARMAKDSSVRVHTIGIGRGDRTILGVRPVDYSELREVAALTGGRFFAAPTEQDLAEVYAAIDELEKVELEDPRYRTVDGFQEPLLLAVSLLLLSLLAEFLWIREVP
jgi:Ca-activated chloride channel family protein